MKVESTNLQNTKHKSRNLWPYGILLTIVIGVVLICVSVYIATKHPVYDDRPFFQKHNDTNSVINQLLEDTNTLQEYYDFYIQANTKPTKDSILKPRSPYLRTSHRDKVENNSPNILLVKHLNTLYVFADRLDDKSNDVKDLKIRAFIQKIGEDAKAQGIHIYDSGVFTKSVPEHQGGQIPIGDMSFDPKEQVFISPSFEIESEGRWIVSLQITGSYPQSSQEHTSINQAKASKSSVAQANVSQASARDQGLFVVLEKEFFSTPKPQIDTKDQVVH